MSKSKKPQYRDIYASTGRKDYFGTLYDGMCKSEAYKALSIGAKQFYTLCRVQAKSTHGKACLYKHGNSNGVTYTANDFVFPATHQSMYGVKHPNARRYFSELEKAGFIVLKENNKHRRIVNVYSFSDKWKNTS